MDLFVITGIVTVIMMMEFFAALMKTRSYIKNSSHFSKGFV